MPATEIRPARYHRIHKKKNQQNQLSEAIITGILKVVNLNFRIMKSICYVICSVIMLTGLSSCSPPGMKKDGQGLKPNIVLFLVDDLGWSDLGCYGSSFYETPRIDQFAREGIMFTNAYAACHVCSPTRASILTGKYPATIHLTDFLPGRREFPFQKFLNAEINQHLPYEEQTIAEVLQENGYKTAIIGKWHLGDEPSTPMEHGFDFHIPDWLGGVAKTFYAPYRLGGLEAPEGEYLTDRLTDEALNYIEENRDNPFFLYFAHYAVHDPIEGRPDLVAKYEAKLKDMPHPAGEPYILEGNPDDEDPLSVEELDDLLKEPEYAGYSVLPHRTVKIKQFQDNVRFAAMVESVDESFRRVLAKLDELGLEENTIVILYSDNGGMSSANFWDPDRNIPEADLDKAFSTSNLPLRGAKGWLYEGGIREPLIIKWPGQGAKDVICDVPVTSPDFYPTILDMLGIPMPAGVKTDGVSIVPLLKGGAHLDREAIYWHFPHYSNHGMQSPGGAIRAGDFKLIEYFENNSVQLFNLKEDIGEQHDLSASEPEKANKLRDMLHQWRQDIDATMMSPNPEYNGAE
jgi:arylsulfatase A